MDEKIVIKTSDFAVGIAPQLLTTAGIGSCVVVCLYEQQKKIGALAHIMLPNAKEDELNPKRFADSALALLLAELEKSGVTKQTLSAKIIGGAHMFKAFDANNDIGTRNVLAVRRLLTGYGIAIQGEDVGGNIGRSVEFNLLTGKVTIFTKA